MAGGIMQLVAYGVQDIYLTGNPQLTFFKVVYRRHTNFAIESIQQTFNGSTNFGKKLSCPISRNGDLLHRIFLELKIKNSPDIDYGQALYKIINFVEIEIGGVVIDRHYGDWMGIWCDLSHSSDKSNILFNMLPGNNARNYIPLQFWFCRNPGLALPLIALQYHEVRLNFDFNLNSSDAFEYLHIYCDFIFLDTDERRRFTQNQHEYLIEQVQMINSFTINNGLNVVDINFKHPVKELIWTLNDGTMDDLVLEFNGNYRFQKRFGDYFTYVQRYMHHSGSDNIFSQYIPYMYSFALKPEEHQPSGSCNFSRVSDPVLRMNVSGIIGTYADLRVFAINYNVLRIMSGMGGLAYNS